MAEGIKKISENVIINKRALVVTDPSVVDNTAISTGALWSDPSKKGLKVKIGTNSFSLFDAGQILISGSITTNLLKDGAITDLKIANGAVTEPKLGDLSVSNRTLQNSAVTEAKIDAAAVTSSKIKDANVLSNHIINKGITKDKLADKAVSTEKVADRAINSLQLNDSSVIARTIGNNAIETRHYANISIPNTAYKKASIYGDVIKDEGIKSSHLQDNSVVDRVIANGAVTEAKIVDKAIKNKHLTSSCVESVNIANNAVTTKAINDGAISNAKYAEKSISKDKLGDDVINLIGNPVTYDQQNNVSLKNDLHVKGKVTVEGTLTANKVFNSVFMDLAEAYEPAEDEIFTPGDIVQVNEDGKLTRAVSSSHFPIVGVVSDEYAACYGATEEELESAEKIPVGLIGKIHVNVIGPVKLGDKIALIRDGVGASCSTNNLLNSNIIGKALESSNETELKKVLCLVYPN